VQAQQGTNNEQPAKVSSHKAEDSLKPEDGFVAPRVIFAPDPEYSAKAKKEKLLSGICIVSIMVDEHGVPHDVQIVRSIADSVTPKLRSVARELDADAVKAVQKYRFQPATLHGKPVPHKINIEINFRAY
jgi:TonB family protein